jgi:DNA primase
MLLANSQWWESLTVSDHEVLCGLDGDSGAIFRWLDTQSHEHGPQPLSALDVAVRGQPFEATALQLIELETMQPTGRMVEDSSAGLHELQSLVRSVRLEVLDLQLKQVQALPPTDPERSAKEAELIREQFELKKQHVRLLKSPEKDIM